MREILFRGKRVDNGKWVYGWYCGKVCDDFFAPAKESAQIIENDTLFWYEVIPETVGQYTGVKDINGKKIFEGDIIKWQYECSEKYHVIFEDGHFIGVKEYGFISLYDTDFEVIGNIHEDGE